MNVRLINILMVLFLSVFLSGCNDDNDTPPPAILTEIQITSDVAALPAGLTTQLSAVGYYSDGLTRDLTYQAQWTSTPPELATVNSGLVRGNQPGDAVINAVFEGVSGTITLTINNAAVQSIILDPVTTTVPQGVEVEYRAIGTFSDQSTHDISQLSTLVWTSRVESVAAVEAGTGIAKTLSAGTTNISATLDSITSNTVTLTVTNAVMTSIWITPESLTMPVGLVRQFTATATYSDNSELDITNDAVSWSSSNFNNLKEIGPGLFQAIREGNSYVSVTDPTTMIESANMPFVKVEPARLKSITGRAGINGNDRDTIALGETIQFSASAIFTDGNEYDVSGFRQVHWQSSDTSIATVTLSGEVKTLKLGSVTITATHGFVTGSSSKVITVIAP